MPSYRIIALAGGVGERLRPYVNETHKCLLKIGEKSIIEHFLDSLIYSEADISMVHLVVGHFGHKFRKLLGNNYRGLKIQYNEIKLYRVTGGAHGLYICHNILLKNPCVVLEADHYMHPDLMKFLMQSEYKNAMLVDSNLSRITFDEEVLAYGSGGLVRFMKWLPPYPKDVLGEALTIFKLSQYASNSLAVLLEHYLLEHGDSRKEFIEPFNRLFTMIDMHHIDTQGKVWLEIDFPHDLEKARRIKFE